MKKAAILTITAFSVLLLSACSSSTSGKSITFTSGVKNGQIKHDMDTVHGKATGYKYVGYGVNGGIMDVAKVKDGKWSIDADDDGGVKHGYFFGSNKRPDEYGDFDKSNHKSLETVTFASGARKSASDFDKQVKKDAAADRKKSSKKAVKKASTASKAPAASTYYSPNYSLDQLARTPGKFKGVRMKFTGAVIQVSEATANETDLRVAVNGDTSQILLVLIDPTILHGNHILEDDKVTIYGKSLGTITYKSTSGQNITAPALLCEKIADSGTSPDGYEQ